MKKTLIQKMLLALIVLLISTMLVACGDDEEPTPTPTVAPPPPTNTTVPPTNTTAPPTATSAPEPTATEAITATEVVTASEVVTAAAQAEQPESPLPAGATQPVSPLAAPQTVQPAPEVITSSTTGSIMGTLIITRPEGDLPVSDMLVGLAEIIKDEKTGSPIATGYDPASPYRAVTDSLGRFALNNVPPGNYALILDAVVNQVMLTDETKDGAAVFVEVKPGEVVDVGTLRYKSLGVAGYVFEDEEQK